MTAPAQIGRLAAPLLALGFALILPSMRANPLLTQAYEQRLENWLGQGDLTFSSLFTSSAGDGQDGYDFHAIADGKGPTFVLMSVFGRGNPNRFPGDFDVPDQIVGGFNPQSWTTIDRVNGQPPPNGGFYTNTPDSADRDAFIFNLTYDIIHRQNPSGFLGQLQTFNQPGVGPSFGGGLDLGVGFDLGYGSARKLSYGDTIPGYDTIVYGGLNRIDLQHNFYQSVFSVDRIEVYTFAPARVPDSAGTVGLLGLSLLGLAVWRRRLT